MNAFRPIALSLANERTEFIGTLPWQVMGAPLVEKTQSLRRRGRHELVPLGVRARGMVIMVCPRFRVRALVTRIVPLRVRTLTHKLIGATIPNVVPLGVRHPDVSLLVDCRQRFLRTRRVHRQGHLVYLS